MTTAEWRAVFARLAELAEGTAVTVNFDADGDASSDSVIEHAALLEALRREAKIGVP